MCSIKNILCPFNKDIKFGKVFINIQAIPFLSKEQRVDFFFSQILISSIYHLYYYIFLKNT